MRLEEADWFLAFAEVIEQAEMTTERRRSPATMLGVKMEVRPLGA